MPFRWTINAYRGCSHACTYCAWGETPILMADGRTRPLANLEVGDEIYGTVRKGSYRRYAVTRVLAHWKTRKSAYRVTLEDGTELIASGDHRFLSNRGWKHVIGAEQGPLQRPHLTVNNKLMGVGSFASAPADSPEYRRGYLCGLIRGDGSIGSYSYDRPGRSHGLVHRFRLALCDLEALRRARDYLLATGVATDEFQFHAATATTRAARAIRTQSGPKVERIREMIRWPWSPADWCKGFLAGIFDGEGSCSRGVLRIANTDQAIIERTTDCLRLLGFDFIVEDRGLANGLKCVRLSAAGCEITFASSTRSIRRSLESGRSPARRSRAMRPSGWPSIEPLGILPLYDITTGTGDFIANGVVSHNCFARPTHTYLGFNAGRDFEREIVVKVNLPEVLRAELAKPSWGREHVALGTNTDPYQWVEGRYKLMPEVWDALLKSDTPCSVLTKSPLLLRDIDVMKRASRACRLHRQSLRADARRGGLAGERAPHATPAQAPGGDRRAQPRRHPHRRADRAAHAGDQRRPQAGGEDPRAGRRGGGRAHRRHRAAPPRRGARRVHGMAALLSARPRRRATSDCTRARPTPRGTCRSGCSGWSAAGAGAPSGARAGRSGPLRLPRPKAPRPRQQSLF